MKGKFVSLLFALLCCALIYEASAAIGPQCLLPLEHGPCRALIWRYGYNPETGQCELFKYGGCHGNQNNFETRAACQDVCA